MVCEIQDQVSRKRRSTRSICSGCLQITGPGLNHSCSRRVKQNASHNMDNISSQEQTRRRKRNMSILIGREATQEQEHIVGSVLSKLRTRKGEQFGLKNSYGGGKGGFGKKITIGETKDTLFLIRGEVFVEIKKQLSLSKNKTENLTTILRKNKVKIQPNVRDKLRDIDHLLLDNYETLRLKFKETIFDDPEIDLMIGKKKKSKVMKEIDIECDLTILKDPKGFIDNLIKVRNL